MVPSNGFTEGLSIPTSESTAAHWDRAYLQNNVHSWNQEFPTDSIGMLQAAGVSATDSFIDIGGGDSHLAGSLIGAGYRDVSVLDISEQALAAGQAQAADGPVVIEWITTDVLSWVPSRTRSVWHDRAVFHFLTDPADQQSYLRVLKRGTRLGSNVVIGTFAENGPTHCSGLPVARYSPESLLATLGSGFDLLKKNDAVHHTPTGVIQPFTWIALRRNGS